MGSQVQCTDTKKQPGYSIQEVCNMHKVISAKDFVNHFFFEVYPTGVFLCPTPGIFCLLRD